MNLSAVVTADVVKSSLLTQKQEKEFYAQLEKLRPVNGFLEFYRGDSFQAYVPDAVQAMHLVLKARTAAKKISAKLSSLPVFDVRASIGIGAVQMPVVSLKTGKGEAFVASGRAFDTIGTTDTRLVISHHAADQKITLALQLIARYCDSIFTGLTTKQAAVVFELLDGATQLEVSKKLNKSQPTINKQAQAARWAEISHLLEDYKQVLTLA